MPLLDSPRSRCTVGAAIDTIVWSMNVIATAKIIAVSTRLLDWPRPLAASVMTLPLRLVPYDPGAQRSDPVRLRRRRGRCRYPRCPFVIERAVAGLGEVSRFRS